MCVKVLITDGAPSDSEGDPSLKLEMIGVIE